MTDDMPQHPGPRSISAQPGFWIALIAVLVLEASWAVLLLRASWSFVGALVRNL